MAAPGSAMGGLDELHAARNSQDASSQRSGSEAWIDGEEGSIDVHRGRGLPQVLRDNEGLRREPANPHWTSVCQVATLTLCAAFQLLPARHQEHAPRLSTDDKESLT
ncbi:hypothetical protein GCM10010448_14340 [Streptomyces glomeratus]|uniref:Uncharacterized protein n=1 Tax=Streptomyces glomeratus TaxID=284452 RepID=A0ABP6L5Z5_9ACTN